MITKGLTLSSESIETMVLQAVNSLIEHVDTVEVSVTYKEEGFTIRYNDGAGNVFARRGAMREWMEGNSEALRENIRNVEEDDVL